MSNGIAVIGCGPAGLLAAHAASQNGRAVTIYARAKEKSVISGAQHLHEAIPDLTSASPDFDLAYIKIGERRGYAEKVYGNPDAPCSWDAFPTGVLGAWSLQAAYDSLWEMYSDRIGVLDVEPEYLPGLLNTYDLTISTASRPSLCKDRKHDFKSASVRITDEPMARELIEYLPDSEHVIVYNGDSRYPYYRTSVINGIASTEYPTSIGLVASEVGRLGYKPISNNCDCWSREKRFIGIGRFGAWRKGVLVHHAYAEAFDWVGAIS
jgi:hypothetical protein